MISTIQLPRPFRVALAHRLPEGPAVHLAGAVAKAGGSLTRATSATASNLAAGDRDAAVRAAHVVVGQPHPDDLRAATDLIWVHLTSAGYTRYGEGEVGGELRARGVALTTSSTVYADPCAEHALAFLLAASRRLHEAAAEQHGARGWPADRLRGASRLLSGARVLVLGWGAIGKRLGALLQPFAAELRIARTRARGDEPAPVVVAPQAIDDAFAWADHVVDTLPDAAATRGYASRARLARMRPDAFFHNVGRGTTVDQDALLEQLLARRLGGAFLDVTVPEPLPPEHPLWSAPGCVITPHAAGGRREEHDALAEHAAQQVLRAVAGEPLLDRVM